MTTPTTMTAIAIQDGKGPASALYPAQSPMPQPGPGELLVKVLAAGVNRPDIVQRNGHYPPPPGAPETLGLEIAGEVVIGAGRWKAGDRVCALLGGGGYAEYAVVDARHALPIPEGLEPAEAACLPETVFTVFSNVFELGGLQAGQTLLLHGGASGIGSTAIQMAKCAGAKVIATGRGRARADAAKALGADIVVDSTTEDFVAVARDHGGADVVLDMVAGDVTARNLDALKPGGRVVVIATLGGSKATIDVLKLMVKRLTLTGSTLRPRSADEKARLAAAVESTVWPWIAAGKLKPVIDRRFPLKDAALAHAHLEDGEHVGKVVLVP